MHLCISIVTIIGTVTKSIILKKWYLSIYINYIMLYSIIKYLSIYIYLSLSPSPPSREIHTRVNSLLLIPPSRCLKLYMEYQCVDMISLCICMCVPSHPPQGRGEVWQMKCILWFFSTEVVTFITYYLHLSFH